MAVGHIMAGLDHELRALTHKKHQKLAHIHCMWNDLYPAGGPLREVTVSLNFKKAVKATTHARQRHSEPGLKSVDH